jgi:hypothetical protein
MPCTRAVDMKNAAEPLEMRGRTFSFAVRRINIDGGRRLRQDLRPRLDDLAERAVQLRDTATRAQRAADEGWRAIQEVAARPSAR